MRNTIINLVDKGNFITVMKSDNTTNTTYRKSQIVTIWHGTDKKEVSILISETSPITMNIDIDLYNGEPITDFDSFVAILQDMIGSGSMNPDEYIFIDNKNIGLHENDNVRLKIVDGVLRVEQRKAGIWEMFIEF